MKLDNRAGIGKNIYEIFIINLPCHDFLFSTVFKTHDMDILRQIHTHTRVFIGILFTEEVRKEKKDTRHIYLVFTDSFIAVHNFLCVYKFCISNNQLFCV